MKVRTKYFGEVELDENKIITFDEGILGFEDCKKWTIMYDMEDETNVISWLQSIDEPMVALPTLNPFSLVAEYNPTVNDEYLKSLGDFSDDELIVLITMTVPAGEVKKATANLRAPFVINSVNRKGVQVIVEGDEFPVKFGIYEAMQKMKNAKGEE